MTFSNHISFFRHDDLKADRDNLKQSISRSDITALPNGQKNKSLSIFSALDKNKDGNIDNSELQEAFDSMRSFAALDRDKRDISSKEMEQYIHSLKDPDGKSLDESDIKPIDIFNFINDYALEEKIEPPRYMLILEMLSEGEALNDNVATDALANIEYYEDLLSDYTNKYNYVGVESSDEAIQDMQEVISKFFEEYGTTLASSSRESLLTNDIADNTSEKLSHVRNGHTIKSRADWLEEKERIKQENFANCGECQKMILDILNENFGDKYEYNAINIKCRITDTRSGIGNETHCAVVLKDKDGEEYVIDPWLNPRDGGIFKKSDWEKLVAEIYRTDSTKIEVNEEVLESIKRESD